MTGPSIPATDAATPRKHRRGRPGIALAFIAAALAAGGGAVWYLSRGEPLPRGVSQEQYDSAETRLRTAVGRNPDRLDILSLLGEVAVGEGRLETAVACFREIPSRHPKYGLSARLQENQVLLRLNRAREAERSLRAYLALAAGNSRVPGEHLAVARRSLAYLFSVELRFEDRKAILADLHAAGAADVYDSKQYYFPSLLISRSAFGKEKLEAFLRHDPGDPVLKTALGRYETGAGDLDAARATLTDVARSRPGDLACVAALLECHFEADERRPFADLAKSLPDFHAGEPWLLTQLRGQFALQESRPDDALRYFERVLEQDPANPICRMGLARAYGASGRAAEREEALRRSLVLSEIRVSLSGVTEEDPQAAMDLASRCDRAGLTEAAETFRGHAERIARTGRAASTAE